MPCNTTESSNLESRRSSSIFLQQPLHQQSSHSEQFLKEDIDNKKNVKKNSVEEWQKPLRKRSATFAEGLSKFTFVNKDQQYIQKLIS